MTERRKRDSTEPVKASDLLVDDGQMDLTSLQREEFDFPLRKDESGHTTSSVTLRAIPLSVRSYIEDNAVDEQGRTLHGTLQLMLLYWSIAGWRGLKLDGKPFLPSFKEVMVSGKRYRVLEDGVLDKFPASVINALMITVSTLAYLSLDAGKDMPSGGTSATPGSSANGQAGTAGDATTAPGA